MRHHTALNIMYTIVQCLLSVCICFLFAVHSSGCWYENNATLKLQCQEHQHIYIFSATLGSSDTSCQNKNTCCPSSSACEAAAYTQHMQQLNRTCNGRQQCQLKVAKGTCQYNHFVTRYEEAIDYELVNYFCINNLPGKYCFERQGESKREVSEQHNYGQDSNNSNNSDIFSIYLTTNHTLT